MRNKFTLEYIIDIHPNLDFGSQGLARRCPCVTGSAKLFALKAMRELSGFSEIKNHCLDRSTPTQLGIGGPLNSAPDGLWF